MSYLPPVQLYGYNFLANGNLRHWPFGNTGSFDCQVGTALNGLMALHWATKTDGNLGNATCQQESSLLSSFPDFPVPPFAFKVTASTNVSSTSVYNSFYTELEAPAIPYIKGNFLTVSFWVYATVAGTYSFCMKSAAPGSSGYTYVTTFTVNSSATWEKKVITIDHSGSTPDSWPTSMNSFGMYLIWTTYMGTARSEATTSLNQWLTSSSVHATSAQTNALATTNNVFLVAQAKLEVNEFATKFLELPPELETARLGRFFEKFQAAASGSDPIGVGFAYSTTSARIFVPLAYPKFSSVSFGGVTSSDTQLFDGVTATNVLNTTDIDTKKIGDVRNGILVQVNVSSGLTQFRPYLWRWSPSVASARSFYVT